MKAASPAPGDWDAHPSAAFQAKVSRREVGAQRRPGPVCPAQGPRGLWAGAYGANPCRLRGGGGQVRRAALGGSRGHRALEDREGAGAAGSARMRGGRSRARGRGPAPPGGPRRERRGDATPHLQAVWPPSGYLTPPCARMLPKAVLNIILLWVSSRLSSHLLRLITPPGSWSPKPGSGSPFHPPPALALGPGAAQPLLFIPNPSFRDF